MTTFPINRPIKPESSKKNVLVKTIYGNRLIKDQSTYEYLVEFLLIFASAKENANSDEGKYRFHDVESENKKGNDSFSYFARTRMGLKRFIFYKNSKKDTSIVQDKEAYLILKEALIKKLNDKNIDNPEKIVDAMQEFLFGYAAILKNRSWCIQSCIPICPELLFCDAAPNCNKRKIKHKTWNITDSNSYEIDTSFDFTKRNFLARGGELYYLHLLQGFENDENKKETLEKCLQNLLLGKSQKISKMVNFIQDTWEEKLGINDSERAELYQRLQADFIVENAFKSVASKAVSELTNFLMADLPIVKRLEVLSYGVMLQILRMITCGAVSYLETEEKPWICSLNDSSEIKKLSVKSYKDVEETFVESLGKATKDEYFKKTRDSLKEEKKVTDTEQVIKEKKEIIGIFRNRGNEIGCIVPKKGGYKRFTLSENAISFLVLALIPPKKQVTLDTFLSDLYEHFKIVIGQNEYEKISGEKAGKVLSKSFSENVFAFERFLNSTGFLIELSDATSVVQNPYESIFAENQ